MRILVLNIQVGNELVYQIASDLHLLCIDVYEHLDLRATRQILICQH